MSGALTHTKNINLGPLTNNTSLGCHAWVPLVPMMFRALRMERCTTTSKQDGMLECRLVTNFGRVCFGVFPDLPLLTIGWECHHRGFQFASVFVQHARAIVFHECIKCIAIAASDKQVLMCTKQSAFYLLGLDVIYVGKFLPANNRHPCVVDHRKTRSGSVALCFIRRSHIEQGLRMGNACVVDRIRGGITAMTYQLISRLDRNGTHTLPILCHLPIPIPTPKP